MITLYDDDDAYPESTDSFAHDEYSDGFPERIFIQGTKNMRDSNELADAITLAVESCPLGTLDFEE